MTPIYRYIYYRVNELIAEDLTEETFLRAWQSLSRYKKGAFPFTSWIFKIAHNLVVDHYRKQRTIEELDENMSDEGLSHEPVRKIELKLNHFTLRKAIRKLPADHQQVIILKYINELENEEISQVMGKSEGAIRLIQFRALGQLRFLMGDKKEDF